MRKYFSKSFGFVAIAVTFLGLSSYSTISAADDMGPKHKLVIQVSSGDTKIQNLALNNASNIQKGMGMDNIAVEIVAYGPGLSILTLNKKNKLSSRVQSLAANGIRFSACNNTMKKIKKKTGKLPKLVDGVKVVPGGVGRILKLQEKGYAYIRP